MLLSVKATLVVRSCKTAQQRKVARRFLDFAAAQLAEAFDHAARSMAVESWVLNTIRREQDIVDSLYLECL